MLHILRVVPLVAVVLVAGCSSRGAGGMADLGDGPMINQPVRNQQVAAIESAQAPRTATASARAMTDVSSFLAPQVVALLSDKERGEAATAQFNALEFGRVGAPRTWTGDRGATGQVSVGPAVTVNNLYCRNFTHTVTVGGQSYPGNGQACKEPDGRWTVASAG